MADIPPTTYQTKRFAIATFVYNSDSYVPGALVLGYSLRKYNTGPIDLICIVCGDVSEEAKLVLSRVFDYVIDVDPITHECDVSRWKRFRANYDWIHSCFTKLHVFQLTCYERVLLLDSDMIALRSCDDLFTLQIELPTGNLSGDSSSLCPTGTVHSRENVALSLRHTYGISGCTLLLHPSQDDFGGMMTDLHRQKPYGNTSFNAGPDEQLVTLYFLNKNKHWTHLGNEYARIAWKDPSVLELGQKLMDGEEAEAPRDAATRPSKTFFQSSTISAPPAPSKPAKKWDKPQKSKKFSGKGEKMGSGDAEVSPLQPTCLVHFVTDKPFLPYATDWPDFAIWRRDARELCALANKTAKEGEAKLEVWFRVGSLKKEKVAPETLPEVSILNSDPQRCVRLTTFLQTLHLPYTPVSSS
ncbi:putative Glycosyl transferase family 8 protein [Blattamonas nauphoetae]|uniref:Glycosyl transferase family 8 protein n=1 Tax=Blattamonas nauphoetae TaxID=2049346 RepID=A0ABQ9YG24_9EUKA|nr:putative Glycosyl transferase family 8 protein [Blattamonas nauphoetae]